MKNRLFRTSLILVLFLALIGITYASFAYWDQLTENDTIEVGVGEATTIEISSEETSDTLIPEEAIVGNGETKKITFTYTVKVNNLKPNMYLDITRGEVYVINTSESVNGLINVYINEVETIVDQITEYELSEDSFTFSISITMKNPKDQDEYNKIAGQSIKFDLTIQAKQKQE